MTIRIISIGKTNVGFVKTGLDEYLGRLKHYAKVIWEELPDPKKVDRANITAIQAKEAEAFMSKIGSKDYLVLLDEGGQEMNSVDFSKWIATCQMKVTGDLVFIIGGAYGFDGSITERAQKKLSLSRMTFNHQMVRMIFAEQLYRAFTILRGEPYHHV